MKSRARIPLAALAMLALLSTIHCQLSTCFAQGTAFTYQGRLLTTNGPASGTYNLQFSLFTVPTSGISVAGPVTINGVVITNGLFTETIDFGGSPWNGENNWLQVAVETNGGGSFTNLSPRQELTPEPYAIFAEGANAAGLSGTVPSGDLNLSGVSGSGLIGLSASQLTAGTVPDARLAADVAFTDANQTFTGLNNFTTGTNAGRLTVTGITGIDTSLFTGLGFQYSAGSGQGAIMSAFNDGIGFLSFYTKQASGFPIQEQMRIDRWGGVRIDQQNNNNGVLNNSTTNGVGLSFGINSGEGIASQRQASGGGNQFGLDFYTDFAQRMSISQAGKVGIGTGTNTASAMLEVNGNIRADGGAVSLQPSGGSFSNDGLVWGDGGLPGINTGTESPFLAGFLGGALGAWAPNTVCFSWDASGDCWVSNNLSTASLTLRGGSSPSLSASGNNVSVSSGFLVVNGLTPVLCYLGDDGAGNDVQIGSQLSGITTVSAYNTADNAFMHFACSSITIKGGSDLAEPFKFSSRDDQVPQGAVVVIDEQNPGRLKTSDRAYDTRVAGVVSGANGIQPGIQMEQQGVLEGGKNVALTGRVYVQAEASNGAIKPGDLLTTSSTPGYAMKVKDHVRAQGAILGKAMSGLEKGRGMVLVLVTLQ